MAGTAEGTFDLIRSGLILGASKWIQSGSDTPNIKLCVERSDIKIVGELWETIDEVCRGDSDGNSNIDTEFVNIPKRTNGTMSGQETKGDGNEK